MALRQRATVRTLVTVPKISLRPPRTRVRRRLAESRGGSKGRQKIGSRNSPEAIQDGENYPRNPDWPRIRVLSVDDHPLFREGIATVVNQAPDMKLIGQVATAKEAIQHHREHPPDITLIDIGLRDGIDALTALRTEFPGVRVIILTALDGDVDVQRALEAGASGYLLKITPPEELLQEIRKVHEGRKGVQPELAAKLAEHIGEEGLTAREAEVLALVAGGNRNREIAEQLHISEETVKVHLRRIREKLGANGRTQAVAIAIRRGFIRI